MRPTEQQVGGSHYKHLKLQPVELAYMLNATPAFKDVAKYLTREKGCRDEDWQKAIHFAQLEEQMIRTYPASRRHAESFKTNSQWLGFCNGKISQFASQFPEPVGSATYTALTCMLRGEYQEVTECIQHYLDMCRRHGWPESLRFSDKNKDYKGR